jgi:MoaA/NifB/PqqE/SkfB family radical SAM enzyme
MPFYKGYWMVTNRCNLDCSYCVLEDSPEQLRRELPIAEKFALLDHLYLRLGFRRLTLSGGEISLLGRNPPTDFIALLNHARRYRMPGLEGHLEIEIYTNGAFIDERCADAMAGVVDQVAITFDGNDPQFLHEIGRSRGRFKNYYESAMKAGALLAQRGIELKIHSVVSRRNLAFLARQLPDIRHDLTAHGIRPVKWKFYQYMSYDDTLRDLAHAITESEFAEFVKQATAALGDRGIDLHFKDNREMHESLFNILSYGNAQYMSDGDSWETSRRTQDLRSYPDMLTLLSQNGIRADLFAKYHTLRS